MMLPVLSSEYFAVVRVDVLGRQRAFACNGIQSTRTTAQVASFESPPGLQYSSVKPLPKDLTIILFAITAAGVAPCGGPKKSPRTSSIVQIIFFF